MGVEIILDEMNGLGSRVFQRELLQKQSVLALSALRVKLSQAYSGLGFNGGQQTAGAVFGVSVVLFGHLAGLGIQRRDDFSN